MSGERLLEGVLCACTIEATLWMTAAVCGVCQKRRPLKGLKQGAGVWLMHGQAGAGSPEVRVILRQALLVLENAALCRLTMAVANRLGGLAFGLLEAFFVKFYQHVVDPAPAGSWPFRFFEFLAKGPLKCARPLHPLCCGSPASQALTCRPRACPCALKCFL